MKPTIQILGSGSRIAIEYCEKNREKFTFVKYSNSNNRHRGLKDFFESKKRNTTVVIFSHIRKNQKKTINLVEKIVDHCKNNSNKLIYISSINAKQPEKSNYSKVKKECENIINNNRFYYLRLGIVVSRNPFGAYKSLLKLKKSMINFHFQKNQILYFTKMESINDINFYKIKSNQTLISYKKNLNKFILNPNAKVKINLHPFVSILRFINKFTSVPNGFDRLLTLTAFRNK